MPRAGLDTVNTNTLTVSLSMFISVNADADVTDNIVLRKVRYILTRLDWPDSQF